MANLVNHPGMWLSDKAANSLARLEADHGRVGLNSAGRYEWEQQNLINRWDKGGANNRPPYLYPPARPASSSNHVKNGGIAFDTSSISKMLSIGAAYGWFQNYPNDPVHFEYDESRDKHKSPTGASQLTRDRQNWLNRSRGAGLVVDGKEGPKTKSAYKTYQTFLKKSWGYSGAIDGIWGPGTQVAHQKYYDHYNTPANPTPPVSGVPSGLRWQGIQEMLRSAGYGYTGLIDGIPGPQTVVSFQRFLATNQYQPGILDGAWGSNTGKAAQRWLKSRWGYKGAIDNVWGAGSKAAWAEAEKQNARAF